MDVDYQDERIEHLNELRLSKKYETDSDAIFYSFGMWHDHSCCPDCCGCDDIYSRFTTFEEYMNGN